MEYIKLFVGKVVDSTTQGSCIPTDSMKGHDDYPWIEYIDSDKANPAHIVSESYEMLG